MNDITRKIFEMLGVKPNEKFKVASNGDILYYIDENLNVMKENKTYCSADSLKDLLIGNFEIIKLPKKKKLRDWTFEEFVKWKENHCITDCTKCIFNNVHCRIDSRRNWINHKDLYSDKFLDQEIEVE